MLSFGDLHLSLPAVLAPMAGISDLPYRTIARRFGCPLAFTEMINARALALRNTKTVKLLESSLIDAPLGVQLLGREPRDFLEALDVLSDYSYSVLDLNAACPVRKVVRKGEGATLLREPDRLFRIIKALVDYSPVPVTVKIRSGWDHRSVNAIEIAKGIADAGACAICVHGRTRSQGYTGRADIEIVQQVKAAVPIPVIASGDILSAMKAVDVLSKTGCDGVMIARGGLGNPWIFRDLTLVLEGDPEASVGDPMKGIKTGDESPAVGDTTDDGHFRGNAVELMETMKDHLSMSIDCHGEKVGVINFRKFFAWYTKGWKNTRSLRPLALKANSAAEMFQFIDKLEEQCSRSS
jgi:tRNA-dihydrouridine synthase B